MSKIKVNREYDTIFSKIQIEAETPDGVIRIPVESPKVIFDSSIIDCLCDNIKQEVENGSKDLERASGFPIKWKRLMQGGQFIAVSREVGLFANNYSDGSDYTKLENDLRRAGANFLYNNHDVIAFMQFLLQELRSYIESSDVSDKSVLKVKYMQLRDFISEIDSYYGQVSGSRKSDCLKIYDLIWVKDRKFKTRPLINPIPLKAVNIIKKRLAEVSKHNNAGALIKEIALYYAATDFKTFSAVFLLLGTGIYRTKNMYNLFRRVGKHSYLEYAGEDEGDVVKSGKGRFLKHKLKNRVDDTKKSLALSQASANLLRSIGECGIASRDCRNARRLAAYLKYVKCDEYLSESVSSRYAVSLSRGADIKCRYVSLSSSDDSQDGILDYKKKVAAIADLKSDNLTLMFEYYKRGRIALLSYGITNGLIPSGNCLNVDSNLVAIEVDPKEDNKYLSGIFTDFLRRIDDVPIKSVGAKLKEVSDFLLYDITLGSKLFYDKLAISELAKLKSRSVVDAYYLKQVDMSSVIGYSDDYGFSTWWHVADYIRILLSDIFPTPEEETDVTSFEDN